IIYSGIREIGMRIISSVFLFSIFCLITPARTDDLPIGEFDIQYCGPQSLRPFKCTNFDPLRDNLIARVCYNPHNDVMLIRLNQYAYCYCGLSAAKFEEFLQSNEMGEFYKREIRGRFRCPNDTRKR